MTRDFDEYRRGWDENMKEDDLLKCILVLSVALNCLLFVLWWVK